MAFYRETTLPISARHSYPLPPQVSARPPHEPTHRRHSSQSRRRPSHFHETTSSSSSSPSPSPPHTDYFSPRTSSSRKHFPHRDSLLEPDSPPTFTSKLPFSHQPHYKPDLLPAPLRLTKYAVLDLRTHAALYTITRNAVHLPPPISSKPLLTITRSASGAPVGSILFHSLRHSTIDISLCGTGAGAGVAKMVHDGPFCKSRWRVSSLLDTGAKEDKRVWFWCEDKTGEWEMREGGKKGAVVAKIGIEKFRDVVVRFEREGLGEEEVDEVVIGAFAVVEAYSRGRGVGVEWGEVDK